MMQTSWRARSLLPVALAALVLASEPLLAGEGFGGPPSEGWVIAGRHKAVFTSPPAHTPSNSAVDAPLLGNGDLLVALGGEPARLELFVGKSDLWTLRRDDRSQPHPLARLTLELPGLEAATYHVEQYLQGAVTRGRFEVDDGALLLETAVAATDNVLWIELSAETEPFRGRVSLSPGGESTPAVGRLGGGRGRIQLGREQYGGGRWYLDGALDEVAVFDRALSDGEIGSLAAKEPIAPGLLRAWSFEDTAEPGKAKGAERYGEGSRGRALLLDGRTSFVDSDPMAPGHGVTVAAFVKIRRHAPDGNAQYILSQGEWNQGWSLGLSAGKLRMAVGSRLAETAAPIALDRWIHVAGTFDGRSIRVFVDGSDATPSSSGSDGSVSGREGTVLFVERRFEKDVTTPSGATCAVRVLDGEPEFVVEPGRPVRIVAAATSRFEEIDFRTAAVTRAATVGLEELERLRAQHEAWWRDFWGKSFLEVPDSLLESRYYLSQYVLASASRVPDFPPGLFGWVTTDTPSWRGDYHMNYNHVAPFYGLYASNHIEQADPCHGPILDSIEVGRDWSRRHCDVEGGILLPVGLGPKGSVAGASLWDQKSNSAYSCVPLAFRWYATYDLDFAREAYEFVWGTVRFWESWLVPEDGRYVVTRDAIHEGSGDNRNPILTLGLLRLVLDLAVDMSTELGVDADRRPKWTHIRERLSEYPTCTVRDLPERFWPRHLPRTDETLDLPIFRYTERGTPWWSDNTLGIQHIYPAGGIGLDDDPALLERARNQIRVLHRWVDFNGMNSFYAAAARVGYDPKIILAEMRAMLERLALPNGMIRGNPHGMEHQSIVPNALQEMLLQSHDGVLRLFPCWPRDLDARFGTLRARGAFLVSAELKSGAVVGVTLRSEKGRDCTIVNPWPGQSVTLLRGSGGVETVSGERFTISTLVGEVVTLREAKIR